jgi:hypothetical protein
MVVMGDIAFITFIVNGEPFSCHRCQEASVLAKWLFSASPMPWKRGSLKERKTNIAHGVC